jgi:outer membrane biosynthesis protein TonB
MAGGTERPADSAPSTWGARLRRQRAKPPALALVASVVLHAAVIAGMWLAGLQLSAEPEFVQYRVTLVSPPPQEEGEPTPEPPAPETPVVAEPEPEAPEPQPEPPKPETPKPAPPKPAPPKPPEPKPDPAPSRGSNPRPDSPGGENLQVQQEGEEFLYPEYLENIVRQLHRMFRWNGAANLEAEVVFYIQRAGTVGGLKVVQRSGNFDFDLAAHEAVDRAGRTGAFGPLPDGWQSDRLWIRFTFEPPK